MSESTIKQIDQAVSNAAKGIKNHIDEAKAELKAHGIKWQWVAFAGVSVVMILLTLFHSH